MKNISTKTKKLARRRFEVQDSWEDSWERDSLIKLKKEIDKTPRPPKYNYFSMGDHPKMVKE